VLVEFLTVLGNLTAELLTPELHAELSTVTLSQGVRRGAGIDEGTDEGTDEEAPVSETTTSA
jgi:hypothetical protein